MDWIGVAALVTAGLGGLATLVVAIATLLTALRSAKGIIENQRTVNGLLDERVESARIAAYQQGYTDCLRELRAKTNLPLLGVPAPGAGQPPGGKVVPGPEGRTTE